MLQLQESFRPFVSRKLDKRIIKGRIESNRMISRGQFSFYERGGDRERGPFRQGGSGG